MFFVFKHCLPLVFPSSPQSVRWNLQSGGERGPSGKGTVYESKEFGGMTMEWTWTDSLCMRLVNFQQCLRLIFEQPVFVFECLSTESSLSSLSVRLHRSLNMKYKSCVSAARTYWWLGSNSARIQRRSCTMCKSDSRIQLKSLVQAQSSPLNLITV